LETAWQADFAKGADQEIADLVPGFLTNRSKELKQVQNWIELGQLDELVRWGHTVKGISAPYGFPSLGEMAAQFEREAKAAHLDQLKPLFSRIQEYVRLALRHYSLSEME